MAVLGKRKAPEPTISSEDAQEIFRRHFEAQFLPLEEQERRKAQKVRRNNDEDEDEDDDEDDGDGDGDGSEDDGWGGVSGDEVPDDDDDDDDDIDDDEDGRSWNERNLSFISMHLFILTPIPSRRSHHPSGRPLRPANLQSKHNVQTRTQSLHGQSRFPP